VILAAGLSLAAGALIGWAVADWMRTRAKAREQYRPMTDRLRLVEVMTKTATPGRK
jgi:Na+/glutamate symporter